ncbi:MAG: SpaH/EbpB family LPXTG-anchored major pilin [Coriobacteriia bacterium]|nr:SpaH/EbpB family LPXTG-anchored major pilin [Coriobacteriia bacterium]
MRKKVLARNRFKAVSVLLIVALMGTAVMMTALADPLPPATGNLYIHKYIGSPTGGTANGTEQNTSTWTDVIPANGIQFDLYKVNTGSGIPAAGAIYALNNNSLQVFSTGGALLGSYPVTSVGSVTTAGNGLASSMNLDQGLYLVIENIAASTDIRNAITGERMYISSAIAPFLVAVPMTNPTGDGWIQDVHVYPKNEELTIVKRVGTDEAVAVGDTVNYTISVSIPADVSTGQRFEVFDEFDPALALVESSVQINTIPSQGGLARGAAGDFEVDYQEATSTMTVSLTSKGRSLLSGYTTMVVSFDITVTAEILTYTDYTASNTATVEYVNTNQIYYEAHNFDDPTIHSAAINITKLNESGAALNGSSFKIATSDANARANRFLRIDSDSVLYDYDPDNPTASTWYTLGSSADYTVSPANTGKFTGLKDKVNGVYQTYYIVETKAPSGYNLLSDPVVVTFNGNETNYTYMLSVTNHQGFVLPVTGGTGVIICTVVGFVLLGIALSIAIPRRRNRQLTK